MEWDFYIGKTADRKYEIDELIKSEFFNKHEDKILMMEEIYKKTLKSI